MAKNCKAIREFLFDELKAAMGQPQGEAERVLMADVCQLEKIKPAAVVSEYRRIHLRNAYRICKENVSEKQGFWGDIGCLLRENGIEPSATLEKAASDSVTGTELYKRIKKCMDEYAIPFQSVEVEAFFYGFFFKLCVQKNDDMSVEKHSRYETFNTFLAQRRLEKILKRKLNSEEYTYAIGIIDGKTEQNMAVLSKIRQKLDNSMSEIYDLLVQ